MSETWWIKSSGSEKMKLALYDWNCVLDEVIGKLQHKHTLLKSFREADKLVVWNECEKNGWKGRIDYAQKKGREVILYQQGVWGVDWVRPPFNEPIVSDTVCVWGPGDKKRLLSYGVPKEKIVITGSPILKHLKPRVEHSGKNVIFALEHWDYGDVVENNIVASELRKLKGVKVITKGLDGENNTFMFDNPIISSRKASDHMDIVADVLSKADIVVAISESTFALLAEVLDIPVVVPDVWIPKPRAGDEKYLEFKKLYSDAVTRCKLEDLNKTIMHQLKHPDILRAERLESAIMNGGLGIKDPVGNLIKVIER